MKALIERWVANVLILLVLLGVGIYSFRESTRAESALCALRHDLELRVERSEQYLDDVEEGRREPIPGLTALDIRRSVDSNETTIRALDGLDCRPHK